MIKFKVFIVGLLLIVLWNCSDKKEQKTIEKTTKFQLKVTVPNGIQKAYLAKIGYAKPIIIDSCVVKNGICHFKGTVFQPEKAIILLDNQPSFPFILENANFEVVIDKNNLKNGRITHSLLNDEYTKIQQKSAIILQKMTPLYYELQEKRLKNNSQKLEEISTKIKAIKTSFLECNMNFIEQNSHSYSSLFVLKDLLNTAFIDTSAFLKETKKLSKNIQQHPVIKEINLK
ncbi:MAG: DUF4369 domain-containing protein [Flavobacteriaceae bacterium]|nr:DUF4369 domain-containing protein [Flavobacteriaceae bacterium]